MWGRPIALQLVTRRMAHQDNRFLGCASNIEQIHREWQTDLGWGEPQGRGAERRSEHSLGIAMLAYGLLLRACPQDMLPGTSWRIAQLQHAFRLRIITTQVEHDVQTRRTKTHKAASFLALGSQGVGFEHVGKQ